MLDVFTTFPSAKPSGDGHMAKCPAHEDRTASLSINTGDDGRVLLKCHAGCSIDDILQAVSLDRRDLFPANGNGSGEFNDTYVKLNSDWGDILAVGRRFTDLLRDLTYSGVLPIADEEKSSFLQERIAQHERADGSTRVWAATDGRFVQTSPSSGSPAQQIAKMITSVP